MLQKVAAEIGLEQQQQQQQQRSRTSSFLGRLAGKGVLVFFIIIFIHIHFLFSGTSVRGGKELGLCQRWCFSCV
jgi:hypothetical protein